MKSTKQMDFEVDKITDALTKIILYVLCSCIALLVVDYLIKLVG